MSKPASLVLELQQLAQLRSSEVTELLRRALVVATKLGIEDFRQWVTKELYGYSDKDVPEYRKIRATLMGRSMVRGLIPIVIGHEALMRDLTTIHVRDAIETLLDLTRSSENQSLQMDLSVRQIEFLLGQFPDLRYSPPVRIVGRNQLAQIADAVRNTILEWSLKLEAEGILGENMTFSKEEKEKANVATSIHIGTMNGNLIGDVSGGQVSQQMTQNNNQGNVAAIRKELKENGVPDAELDELEKAIEEDKASGELVKAGSFGGAVGKWLGGVTAKAAVGIIPIAVDKLVSLAKDLLAQ